MRKAIAIVGAGMAGLSCANALQTAGHNVRMFEKGYRASGRMATRSISTPKGDASFDIGAQYFSVRDPLFAGKVAQWQAMGLIAPWPSAGPNAFVGTTTMRAPLEQMASELDVRWNVRVEALKRLDGRWGLGRICLFTMMSSERKEREQREKERRREKEIVIEQ